MYADSVSIVCWIKVSTFIISVLFVVWPPGVEAICAFFGLFPVMLLVWDCFKIRISFFRFSISLSLGLGSCLLLEVFLDGDFQWLCGRLFGFNIFSLFRSVWDSLYTFIRYIRFVIYDSLYTFPRSAFNIQNRILVWVNNSYQLFGKMQIFVLVENIHWCID